MGEGRFGGRALSYLMQDPGLPGGVYAGAMVELDVLERVQGKQWKDELGLVVLPAGVYRASPTRVSRLWSEPRPGTTQRS